MPIGTFGFKEEAIERQSIGGRFYLINNRYCGFSVIGPGVQNHNHNWGVATGSPNPNYQMTGFSYERDMLVDRLCGWVRGNAAGVLPWSWVVMKQQKIDGEVEGQINEVLLQQDDDANPGGLEPREFNLEVKKPLLAGEVLGLAVRCGSTPTTRYIYTSGLSFCLKPLPAQ